MTSGLEKLNEPGDLTERELKLIYDAIIREGRLPGGAVRLVDPKGEYLK
jgi:hypothetical protein